MNESMKNVFNNNIKNIPNKKKKKKKKRKEETLSKKYARQGHAKESEKEGTNLSDEERSGK